LCDAKGGGSVGVAGATAASWSSTLETGDEAASRRVSGGGVEVASLLSWWWWSKERVVETDERSLSIYEANALVCYCQQQWMG
jgi:hypothetical protein